MRPRIMLSILIALACGGCSASWGEVEAATNDEMAERQAIEDAVESSIERRDFAELNAMAADYRSKRSRTPSGTWKLSRYYRALFVHLPEAKASPTCPNPNDGFVDDWLAAHPDEPAAHMAKARLVYDYGFCLRGSAFASRSSASQLAGFQEQIDRAIGLLESRRETVSVDPQYYVEAIRLHGAGGGGKVAIQAMLEEGADKEPYYYEIYFAAAEYLRPQWWGLPGDQDKLARLAADNTSQDGKGSYARLVWYVDQMESLPIAEIDWTLMVEAMDDIAEKYPSAWNSTNFARLACKFGDYPTAKRHLATMTSDVEGAWSSEQERIWCKAKASIS